jgi:hypothetical protein
MTKAKDFVKALQTAGHGGVETVDDARNRQKLEWLRDLDSLLGSIRHWLEPVREAGLATVADKDFSLAEPDVGQYAAPGMEITFVVAGETRTVSVRPRGLRIAGVVATGGARAIGARGRVDLESGVAREILLRFKDAEAATWVSFTGGEKRPLDEDVFFELVARVADVNLR